MNSRLFSVSCAILAYSALAILNRFLNRAICSASLRATFRAATGEDALGLALITLRSLVDARVAEFSTLRSSVMPVAIPVIRL